MKILCSKKKIKIYYFLRIIFGLYTIVNMSATMRFVKNYTILRKTIEGYLDSVSSLTFNTIKTLLIMHVFHSSRHLQSKRMLYFSHVSMV